MSIKNEEYESQEMATVMLIIASNYHYILRKIAVQAILNVQQFDIICIFYFLFLYIFVIGFKITRPFKYMSNRNPQN